MITITSDFVEPEYSNLTKDYTINLAWHQVSNKEANKQVYERIKDNFFFILFTILYFELFSLSRNIIIDIMPVTRKSIQLITQAQETI